MGLFLQQKPGKQPRGEQNCGTVALLSQFPAFPGGKKSRMSPHQAWFLSFLSSFVAQVARVFVLFVLDLLPSVSSSWIMGLASTNFRTSFPKAVHKSLEAEENWEKKGCEWHKMLVGGVDFGKIVVKNDQVLVQMLIFP